MINLSAAVVAGAPGNSETRTGSADNQPAGGFTEGTTAIRIENATGVLTTEFPAGAVIYVNITTPLFAALPNHGYISLFDYSGAEVASTQGAQAFEMKNPGGTPGIFTSALDTSTLGLADDHYLLVTELKLTPGNDIVKLFDVIKLGTGGSVQRSIELSNDPAFAKTAYKFNNHDTIYLKVYTTGAIDLENSHVRLFNYFNQKFELTLDSLANSTIRHSGNYSILELDLADDFSFQNLGAGFAPGGWYTLQVGLEDTLGTAMASSWSVQFMVAPAPEIASVDATPSVVEMTGSDTTNITINFTDTDAAGAGEFKFTLKVRDNADNVYTLVEDKSTGQGMLVVHDMGGGNYSANFTWDPPGTLLKGEYDLYTTVTDGNASVGVSDFLNNANELELTTLDILPVLVHGNTYCYPAVVDRAEGDKTTIMSNFTDPMETDRRNLDATFSIRSPTGTEIVLVDKKGHDEAGEFGGNIRIADNNGWYTASYDWDPPVDAELGLYDLFFEVENGNGAVNDSYDNNTDELEIIDLGLPPAIDSVTIRASPSSLDKVGNYETTFFGEFTDADEHPIADFDITLMIKNKDNDEITLLDGTSHDEAGAHGGTLTLDSVVGTSPLKYSMTYAWDPDETTPEGVYDISLEVVDPNSKSDKSGYNANQEELSIISSVQPPEIKADSIAASPTVVNKIGEGTTRLSAEFTDTAHSNTTDFNVTFKVRDPNNNITVLVDDKATGGAGEAGGAVSIEFSGTIFIARYAWDPPKSATTGFYDILFSVGNTAGGFAEIGFGASQDKVNVITTATPPVVSASNTTAVPDVVDVMGANTTMISSRFTDENMNSPSDFSVWFKVRNQSGGEIVLVNGKVNGSAADAGGMVLVENGSENRTYIASYEWDPPEDTDSGKYDLFFAVEDDSGALITDGFDNNLAELTLTKSDEPVVIEGPGLEDVRIHHEEDTWYNFTVNYTNTNNLPPDEHGIVLTIDGEEHKMLEVNASDTDYTDGKNYYLLVNVTEHEIEYHTKVNDTAGDSFSSKPWKFVPDEGHDDEHEEHEETPDTGWQVILTLVLIFILLVLILVFSRFRKSKGEDAPAETPPEERAEAAEEPPMAEPVDEVEGEDYVPVAAPAAEPAEPAAIGGEPEADSREPIAEPAEPVEPAEPAEDDANVTKIPNEPPEELPLAEPVNDNK